MLKRLFTWLGAILLGAVIAFGALAGLAFVSGQEFPIDPSLIHYESTTDKQARLEAQNEFCESDYISSWEPSEALVQKIEDARSCQSTLDCGVLYNRHLAPMAVKKTAVQALTAAIDRDWYSFIASRVEPCLETVFRSRRIPSWTAPICENNRCQLVPVHPPGWHKRLEDDFKAMVKDGLRESFESSDSEENEIQTD